MQFIVQLPCLVAAAAVAVVVTHINLTHTQPLLTPFTQVDQTQLISSAFPLKEGSKTDFNLLSEFSTNSMIIRPNNVEQQGYPYVFESEDKIRYYLELACRLTPNLNLDSIFRLLKTEFKQYVVLDDHYITLLRADTIWSWFQDKFSTTHYLFCLGDNSSGKNAILVTYYSFGYRVFMAGSVSGPNVLSALGNVEAGQITLAEDEVDSLDNEHDKMTLWKMGYCQTGSRVPKTDLNAGRKQDLYYTYCFKICASERSLDNAKARGLLDRCFIIPCIAGRPTHNIKRVRENTKKNKHLMNEIEKTRKVLFAIRMVHYDDVIEEIGLNREAELTEPTLRLFQYSPNTLKELQPASPNFSGTGYKCRTDTTERHCSSRPTRQDTLVSCWTVLLGFTSHPISHPFKVRSGTIGRISCRNNIPTLTSHPICDEDRV